MRISILHQPTAERRELSLNGSLTRTMLILSVPIPRSKWESAIGKRGEA